MATVIVALQGAQQLHELSKRLRAAGNKGKGLQKELNQAIRKAARPAVADVRESVRTLHVRGTRGGGTKARRENAAARARSDRSRAAATRGGGLRETTARATRVSVTARGVRIEVDRNRFPADQRNLPRALDNPKGWRKPTFGNREAWTRQYGGPWFFEPNMRNAPTYRRFISDAMDNTARRIEG